MGEVIDMPEDELEWAMAKLAGLHGWRCYHTKDSRRSEKGFGDLGDGAREGCAAALR